MAQVTVNYNEKSYIVDNGVNKKAFKSDNLGGGTQRTFGIYSIDLDIEEMTYRVKFKEFDSDEANGYESPRLSNIGIGSIIEPSWIVSGKLDLKLLKVDAINKLFESKLEITPLNASGTVKAEYQ